jgi:sRNA-binding carbon storage regulator CsrA
MALVLSLRKGDDFYIGDQQFVVDTIDSDVSFQLKNLRSGRCFFVSDGRAVRLMKGAYVSAGVGNPDYLYTVKLSIEADRQLLVLRGDIYRNPPDEREHDVDGNVAPGHEKQKKKRHRKVKRFTISTLPSSRSSAIRAVRTSGARAVRWRREAGR